MVKKILLVVMLLFPVVSVAAMAQNIDSRQARTILSQKKKIFLLDVRTPEEYRQAHIQGAVLIPLDDLKRRIREVPKDRPVLVYCAVGARSASAAGYLASKGHAEVYHMVDGLVGWYRNGFPVER